MILMSQAYVLKRIWKIKTSNKSYLKCLSKSWTFHSSINKILKIFLYEQGVISYRELSNFQKKNWNEWLKDFNRYNLSPKIWYGIKPQQWRFKVNKYWQRVKNPYCCIAEGDPKKKLSVFFANSSLEQIKKRNKLFKNNFLTYSYFDLNKNSIIKKLSRLNKKLIYNNSIMEEISKYRLIYNKDNFSDFNKKKIIFKYNFLLWLVPEFLGQKSLYQHKKILNLDTFVIKNENAEILRNKDLLREKELNQSIRQWKWKSNNSEKKFRKLGNMASLMTFMQNQETMISLSGKMREDLNFFHLLFRTNTSQNRLTINSEHRLPRLLDDEILIYKMISTLLSFKQRLRKIGNIANINKYDLNEIIINNEKNSELSLFNYLNLEDILLPKRRREFRILNCLSLSRERCKNSSKKMKVQDAKIGMNKNKIIKRFIWPSYRFEDLASINRFWFSTMNGSRFSMLRFRIYPPI
nr:Ycf1 [Pleurozia subinflata]